MKEIFRLYEKYKKETKHLSKLLQEKGLQTKEPVKKNWAEIEKKLIDGHWWVKSSDALK
tara:strand:- start:4638 stop:4814 length:177 start_codon:yes stop_codon:yes gene_type:complete